MSIVTTVVKNLNINELTEAQYDSAVQQGLIGDNELSILTDAGYDGDFVPQCEVMPEPTEEDFDRIVQYVGPTDQNYTNGYFYKCYGTYTSGGSDESGSGESGESGSGSGEFEDYYWDRVNVQPSVAMENPSKYYLYDKKYGWSFDTGFGLLTLYTANENPVEGDILYQKEGYAVPSIALKSQTTGLVVPYIGWVRVAQYIPASGGLPDRILITVGGVTPLVPNTGSFTQPILKRVTETQ